jgi:hypothetical protein
MLQSSTIPQTKLYNGIGNVELDCVETDVETVADLRIGHAMTHGVHDTPFGGSEDVRMRGAAASHRAGY